MLEQKQEYTCTVCGDHHWMTFTQAQFFGWYWMRRVGEVYDYFCPAHDPRKMGGAVDLITALNTPPCKVEHIHYEMKRTMGYDFCHRCGKRLE